LQEFPFKVRFLGLGDTRPWQTLRKLELLHEYAASISPEKILFVLDFFDVVWLGCDRDLIAEFLKIGAPLVFGAELKPYPLLNTTLRRLPAGYPVLPGTRPGQVRITKKRDAAGRWDEYRYLNSGCMVGYAGALALATGRMVANGFNNDYVLRSPLARTAAERKDQLIGEDDQVAWHSYAIQHPEEIALDYDATIFLNAFGFEMGDFDLQERNIWSKPFSKQVCFAHGNGASNLAMQLLETQRMGVQPSTCRDEVRIEAGVALYGMICG